MVAGGAASATAAAGSGGAGAASEVFEVADAAETGGGAADDVPEATPFAANADAGLAAASEEAGAGAGADASDDESLAIERLRPEGVPSTAEEQARQNAKRRSNRDGGELKETRDERKLDPRDAIPYTVEQVDIHFSKLKTKRPLWGLACVRARDFCRLILLP